MYAQWHITRKIHTITGILNFFLATRLSTAQSLAQAVKESGSMWTRLIDVDPSQVKRWHVSASRQQFETISPGGPADKAGLKNGDILMEVGGRDVLSEYTAREIRLTHGVGETVQVVVLRDGARFKATVLLRPAQSAEEEARVIRQWAEAGDIWGYIELARDFAFYQPAEKNLVEAAR
jgi:hypothetical protein